MSNPLYQQFGGQSELAKIMEEAKRLKQTFQDPRAEVERLLKSGAMSQSDFNRFAATASQILGAR